MFPKHLFLTLLFTQKSSVELLHPITPSSLYQNFLKVLALFHLCVFFIFFIFVFSIVSDMKQMPNIYLITIKWRFGSQFLRFMSNHFLKLFCFLLQSKPLLISFPLHSYDITIAKNRTLSFLLLMICYCCKIFLLIN